MAAAGCPEPVGVYLASLYLETSNCLELQRDSNISALALLGWSTPADDIPFSMTGRLLALLGIISWHITGFNLPARWCIGSKCARHEGALRSIAKFQVF